MFATDAHGHSGPTYRCGRSLCWLHGLACRDLAQLGLRDLALDAGCAPARFHRRRNAADLGSRPLLHGVRQFVREQLSTPVSDGVVRIVAKDDIATVREGDGAQRACSLRCVGAGVDAHVGEVGPEAALIFGTDSGRHRRAAAIQVAERPREVAPLR